MSEKNVDGLYCKYFVLNPNKDDVYGEASRLAIRWYADKIKKANPKFSEELNNWVKQIESIMIAEKRRSQNEKEKD